jgi:hypothetical protein
MSPQIRSAELATVFAQGTSPLLNHLARLSILYEDLRLEFESILNGHRVQRDNYDSLYFIRRSLVTIAEFHGCLIDILKSPEYRQADKEKFISSSGRKMIVEANGFFEDNKERIKKLRNHLGAHLKPKAVEFAVESFHPADMGQIALGPQNERRPCLRLHYATQLLQRVIVSRLPSETSVEQELNTALGVIGGAQDHAIQATYALVGAFLWQRFRDDASIGGTSVP